MDERPIFKTIAEKLRYFADRKFGKLPPTQEPPSKIVTVITPSQNEAIGEQAHYAGQAYPFSSTKNEAVAIPYFSNEISQTEVIKEPKHATRNNHPFSLSSIVQGMMAAVMNKSVQEFNESTNMITLLLELPYPITTQTSDKTTMMNFTSSIIQGAYTKVSITDPILYAMVLDYSKYVIRNSQNTLYLMGSDIMREFAEIDRASFDTYFVTLLKSFFATTLLGRNTDEIKLLSFPSYKFSIGTYHSDHVKHNDKIVMVQTSHTLLHVLPLWSNVFYDSYLIQLTSLTFDFSYRQGTLFRHYENVISTTNLPQLSNRLQHSVLVPMRVSLSEKADDVSPYDVYCANLRVRNNVASNLDNVSNFNQVKDRMYPKGRDGAKTKLLDLLTYVDLSKSNTVLELGAAPGTWTQALISMDKFKSIDAVTSIGGKSLTIYPNIVKLINESENAVLHQCDAIKFLNNGQQKYDLILSDVATKSNLYVTQSTTHDALYSGLIHGILSRLAPNATMIFKMYDLTEHMHDLLSGLSSSFVSFKVVKPKGSCPTNPEVYIIAQGYSENINAIHDELVPMFNILLTQQIAHLNRLVTTGFNIHISYNLAYNANRLRFNDITQLPYTLVPCLQSLKFSEYLYPPNFTGCIYDETTLLGDKYLRFKWDVPIQPYSNQIYMLETTVGYESKGVALQNVFTIHTGFIIEQDIRKDFFIVEKEASCLFSSIYDQTCITTEHSYNLPDNQFTLPELLKTDLFCTRFPNVFDFHSLLCYIQQLSLRSYLDLQTEWSVNSSKLTINQFFRDSQALHLHYTKINLYTSVTNYGQTRQNKKLNLTKTEDRRTFDQKFKIYNTKHTTRESFRLLLNEYSILYREDELLKTSICTTERAYIEHNSRQICVSQPACVQFRRAFYIH